ncbi:MAG: hypothetical protein AMXMBFR33_09650 [Candidatus Xenobia bacterium]|jgi:hypothetical protein
MRALRGVDSCEPEYLLLAKALVEEMGPSRTYQERAWRLHEVLERWFRHRHPKRRHAVCDCEFYTDEPWWNMDPVAPDKVIEFSPQ